MVRQASSASCPSEISEAFWRLGRTCAFVAVGESFLVGKLIVPAFDDAIVVKSGKRTVVVPSFFMLDNAVLSCEHQ